MQIAANVAPLTHVVRIVRALVLGRPDLSLLWNLGFLVAVSLALTNVAIWRMKRRLII